MFKNGSDAKEYFEKLQRIKITDNEENLDLIRQFKTPPKGGSLVGYLKKQIIDDIREDLTDAYWIKDGSEVIAYFTLKYGLIVEEKASLAEGEKDYLDEMVSAISRNDLEYLNTLREYDDFSQRRRDDLYLKALDIIDKKNGKGNKNIKQDSVDVERCFPSIEIAQLCKNGGYGYHESFPLSAGVFWTKIVPLIIQAADIAGCKYAYLFAADDAIETSDNEDDRSLVRLYESAWKFSDTEYSFIRPRYDSNCLGMTQTISDLRYNKEKIWSILFEEDRSEG